MHVLEANGLRNGEGEWKQQEVEKWRALQVCLHQLDRRQLGIGRGDERLAALLIVRRNTRSKTDVLINGVLQSGEQPRFRQLGLVEGANNSIDKHIRSIDERNQRNREGCLVIARRQLGKGLDKSADDIAESENQHLGEPLVIGKEML